MINENKKILTTAIIKLKEVNDNLLKKKKLTADKIDKQNITKQINTNNSLILDYQFRLTQI